MGGLECGSVWEGVFGALRSSLPTAASVIKMSISAGTYTIPYAVRRLGFGVALALVVLMSVISVATIEMLLHAESLIWYAMSKEERAARRAKRRPLTFSEIASLSFPDFGCEVHAPPVPHVPAPTFGHLAHVQWAIPHLPHIDIPHWHGSHHEHHEAMHTTLDGERVSPPSAASAASGGAPSAPATSTSPSPSPSPVAMAASASRASAAPSPTPPSADAVSPPVVVQMVPHNPHSIRLREHATHMSDEEHRREAAVAAADPHYHVHHHHYPFLNLLSSVVASSMVVMSVGAVAVYIVFVMSVLPTAIPGITPAAATTIATCVIGALALVPDVRWLAFSSIVGTISETTGVVTVLVMGFTGQGEGADGHLHPDQVNAFPSDTLAVFSFIGTLAFLFTNHTSILPVFQTLARRGDGPAITRTAYVVDSLVNATFGILGALLFGSSVQPNIIANLGSGSPVISAVKTLMCVDLCLTSPLILASGRELVEKVVERMPIARAAGRVPFFFIVRLGLVLLALLVGLSVPSFPKLITIMGGLLGCSIAFIIPPLFMLRLVPNLSVTQQALLWATIAFGAVAVVGATLAGITE